MHEHDWKPESEAMAAYSCTCGATGYRVRKTGEIREHKRKREFPRDVEARAKAGPSGGRVRRRPGSP
jgi:hypothetical protein